MSEIIDLLVIKAILAFRRMRRHPKPEIEPVYFGVLLAVLVMHAAVIGC